MIRLDPFYPIAPDFDWLARFIAGGARLVQLRIKNASSDELRAQIVRSLALCTARSCQLVVNDYWQEAIELGADFVHLGQEDLARADLAAIRRARIKLGISTHSQAELDTALAAGPAYVALGPIYETKLKLMPWAPQGLERIAEWRKKVSCPLVAIGGITAERAPAVLEAGADAAAVITDIVANPDPEAHIKNWIAATAPWRKFSTDLPQVESGSGSP